MIVVAFGMVFFIAKDTSLTLGRIICRSVSIPTDICYSFQRQKQRGVTFWSSRLSRESRMRRRKRVRKETQYLETRSAAFSRFSLFAIHSWLGKNDLACLRQSWHCSHRLQFNATWAVQPNFSETTKISTHKRFTKASLEAGPLYHHLVTLSREDISLPEAYQIRKLRKRNLAINDQHFERGQPDAPPWKLSFPQRLQKKKKTLRRVLFACVFCPMVVNWKTTSADK